MGLRVIPDHPEAGLPLSHQRIPPSAILDGWTISYELVAGHSYWIGAMGPGFNGEMERIEVPAGTGQRRWRHGSDPWLDDRWILGDKRETDGLPTGSFELIGKTISGRRASAWVTIRPGEFTQATLEF